MLLLQCVAAAPASRSPHSWRTTPTAAATPAGLVASHLLRGPLGAALQASDETKRGRASACSNDALCRLQRSEHSDAYASQLACNNLQSARCKMPLTALYDSTVRLEALQKNNPSL